MVNSLEKQGWPQALRKPGLSPIQSFLHEPADAKARCVHAEQSKRFKIHMAAPTKNHVKSLRAQDETSGRVLEQM